MPAQKTTHRNPWAWVPSLYLAEGLPYAIVMNVAVILYKGLGISNTDIALYTSWLYLPWVIKPLWSPVVDILKTRRAWIWAMQIIIGGGMAGLAMTIPTARAFQFSLACFWLLAFASATQDIAIDGFYLLATTEKEQSFFVGIRSTFYRISMIFGQGLLVIVAGFIQDNTGLPKVNLHVEARPGVPLIQSINPPALTPSNSEDGLRILCRPVAVVIDPQPRPKLEIATLVAAARSNNLYFAFYPIEEKPAAVPGGYPWWRRAGRSLEEILRSHFGRSTLIKNDIVGNIGVTTLSLSRPPGREIVVTLESRAGFGLGAGDGKNFVIVEGSRLVFNDRNWNQPALAVVQLDPKLKTAATTVLEISSGNIPFSWTVTFYILAGLFVLFCIYHRFVLPRPESDKPGAPETLRKFMQEFLLTFGVFFKKQKIVILLSFLLCYRFAEAQLVRMVGLFLLDSREAGGIGLTTSQFGFVYGTVGIIALTCGGLLGGVVVARRGLKFWLWWMVLAIHLPDAVFVYLAYALPDSLWIINACVAIEQFGYGFGFAAYLLYMIYISRGEHATAHYAICTGFMALGMMVPGMVSGWLQDIIGYPHFFIWVLLATIPGFLVVKLIPLDADFGKQNKQTAS